MTSGRRPELSVIIPTLNEEAALPGLLEDLLGQQGVDFEILVSDGGSADATCERAAAVLGASTTSFQVLTGSAGRGRQLNRAVRHALGDWLLFLHADSRFDDNTALARGMAIIAQRAAAFDDRLPAARFTLKFGTEPAPADFELFLCEAKARLDQPGCIHGDQGFLLPRRLFDRVGPFREDLPVMEDTWLAERIRQDGAWLLLPVEIRTSPRRFDTEGIHARQTLNALLVNFLFVGWDAFLRQAPDLYRRQSDTRRLRLLPFWEEIERQLRLRPRRERWRLWYRTGRFVRGQAWQLVFRRAARRSFTSGETPAMVRFETVRRFRGWFDPLTDHPLGYLLTGLLTWAWFRSGAIRLRRQRA